MNIILDTCIILYAAGVSNKLSKTAVELMENPLNQLFLSPISSYEIIVKYKLGKLNLSKNPIEFIRQCREEFNLVELPVTEKDVECVFELPQFHGDPFDRIIISQAISNNFFLLTPDQQMHNYKSAKIIW